MELSTFLQNLRADPDNHDRIVYVHEEGPRAALFGEPDRPLAQPLRAALAAQGISRLYIHQAKAVAAARTGRHVGIVTATASGKTLCYHLPTIEALLADPRHRALYLFPTKALAQDQLRALRDLAAGLPHIRPAI